MVVGHSGWVGLAVALAGFFFVRRTCASNVESRLMRSSNLLSSVKAASLLKYFFRPQGHKGKMSLADPTQPSFLNLSGTCKDLNTTGGMKPCQSSFPNMKLLSIGPKAC